MTTSQLVLPAILVPFLAWRYYRRFKSLVGRQLFKKNSLLVFGCIMVAAVVLSGLYAANRLLLAEGLAGGALIGAALAFLGLKLTRFESVREGQFYTPNAWLGLSVFALFAGRLVYRFIVLYAAFDPSNPPARAAGQSPLTLFFFGITAAYYAVYYFGVIVKFRKSGPYPPHRD